MTDYTLTLITDTALTVRCCSLADVPAQLTALALTVSADFADALDRATDEHEIAAICKRWARAVTR